MCPELRDLGVRAVGSDSPTCDMAWVDGEPTAAYFAALPLKIEGGSGSPVRRVAFVPTR